MECCFTNGKFLTRASGVPLDFIFGSVQINRYFIPFVPIDIFTCVFQCQNVSTGIKISLDLVTKDPNAWPEKHPVQDLLSQSKIT